MTETVCQAHCKQPNFDLEQHVIKTETDKLVESFIAYGLEEYKERSCISCAADVLKVYTVNWQ